MNFKNMKAMKNTSTFEKHDLIEMRVIHHARKINAHNFIKIPLMIGILGLLSLFSKLWAQIPLEGTVAVYQGSVTDEHREIVEQLLSFAAQQQSLATAATMEANNARLAAESIEKEKNKLVYLSAAQNMAVKSLHINDPSLQGLIAQQAYLFNTQYEGNHLDRNIYESLYYALKTFSGDSLYRLNGHRGVVRDLAINSKGNKLFSAGTDGKIMDWDLADPNNSSRVILSSEINRGKVIKITSDDRWVIIGTDASSIICFDLQNMNKDPLIINEHKGGIIDIAICPDNQHFVSLGNDKTLIINDLASGQGHLMRVLNEFYVKMVLSPDGKYLALAAENGKLAILTSKNFFQEYIILPAGGPVNRSLAFNPAGDKLAAGNIHGMITMIDLSTGLLAPEITHLKGHVAERYINDIAFNVDGTMLASGGFDGTILLWDMNNIDDLPVILRDNRAKVWSLVFSKDNEHLYAGCEDGSIKMWPMKAEFMADQLKGKLKRELTSEEWQRYVGMEPVISLTNGFSLAKP
jgi:WD40 repeat protein